MNFSFILLHTIQQYKLWTFAFMSLSEFLISIEAQALSSLFLHLFPSELLHSRSRLYDAKAVLEMDATDGHVVFF